VVIPSAGRFQQIEYTEAILSNSTRKLLWLEISEMLIAVLKNNFIVSFIIVFGTLSFRIDDDDWVKKCMEHEVEGSRPRGRPKNTWKEVVRDDCQARKLNKDVAMDRCKWRKVIKEAR